MAQGGDFTNGDGTGGYSIYGPTFDDENFDLNFTRPYLLAMANAGPNTNGSQFFITFEETPWLDGHHVIFGEVIQGKNVVDMLEQIGTQAGTPKKKAIVKHCGILEQTNYLQWIYTLPNILIYIHLEAKRSKRKREIQNFKKEYKH